MSVSAARKSVTRDRIVRAAGRALRRGGYAAAKLGDVLAEAGLTHGAFYARFPSKAALFAEVARVDHDLLARLAEAEGAAGGGGQGRRGAGRCRSVGATAR